MLALGAYALAAPAREQYVLMSPEPTECQTKCIALMPPSVHGDPMFKVNGTGAHFWIKEGELTPLMSWTADAPKEGQAPTRFTLIGKTFGNPNTGSQWFDEFLVSNGTNTLYRASMEDSIMKVKDPSTGEQAREMEEAQFDVGGFRMNVFSSLATKYGRRNTDRVKYTHLNIDFVDFLPPDAIGNPAGEKPFLASAVTPNPCLAAPGLWPLPHVSDHIRATWRLATLHRHTPPPGIFPELSGNKPMTSATKALLRPVPAGMLADSRAVALSAEEKQTRQSSRMAPAAKQIECVCPSDTIHPTPFDANEGFLSPTALKCDDLPDLAKPDASGSPFVLEGVTYDGEQLSTTGTATSAEECRKECLFEATGDADDEQVAFSWNSENNACSCHGHPIGSLGVAADGKKLQTGIVCYKDGEECTDGQTSPCYKKPTAATASAMKKQVAQRRVAEAETELRKAQARRPTMSLVCFPRLATASYSISPPPPRATAGGAGCSRAE